MDEPDLEIPAIVEPSTSSLAHMRQRHRQSPRQEAAQGLPQVAPRRSIFAAPSTTTSTTSTSSSSDSDPTPATPPSRPTVATSSTPLQLIRIDADSSLAEQVDVFRAALKAHHELPGSPTASTTSLLQQWEYVARRTATPVVMEELDVAAVLDAAFGRQRGFVQAIPHLCLTPAEQYELLDQPLPKLTRLLGSTPSQKRLVASSLVDHLEDAENNHKHAQTALASILTLLCCNDYRKRPQQGASSAVWQSVFEECGLLDALLRQLGLAIVQHSALIPGLESVQAFFEPQGQEILTPRDVLDMEESDSYRCGYARSAQFLRWVLAALISHTAFLSACMNRSARPVQKRSFYLGLMCLGRPLLSVMASMVGLPRCFAVHFPVAKALVLMRVLLWRFPTVQPGSVDPSPYAPTKPRSRVHEFAARMRKVSNTFGPVVLSEDGRVEAIGTVPVAHVEALQILYDSLGPQQRRVVQRSVQFDQPPPPHEPLSLERDIDELYTIVCPAFGALVPGLLRLWDTSTRMMRTFEPGAKDELLLSTLFAFRIPQPRSGHSEHPDDDELPAVQKRHYEQVAESVSLLLLQLLKVFRKSDVHQALWLREVLHDHDAVSSLVRALGVDLLVHLEHNLEIGAFQLPFMPGLVSADRFEAVLRASSELAGAHTGCPRKVVVYLNALRLLNKLAKRHEATAHSLVFQHRRLPRRLGTIFQQLGHVPQFRLFTLKLFKAMMPFLDARWRNTSKHMAIVSAVPLMVRLDLGVDWLEMAIGWDELDGDEHNHVHKRERAHAALRERLVRYNREFFARHARDRRDPFEPKGDQLEDVVAETQRLLREYEIDT